MSNFGLSCSVGIGDIIYVNNIMENEKYKFNNIFINPIWPFIDKWKNGSVGYREFINELIKVFFTDKKYIFNSPNDLPHISIWQLVHEYKMRVTRPNLLVLCDEKVDFGQRYIVVTTKVRELNHAYYSSIRNDFINILKQLSDKYKIVLIGEKEVEMTTEYVIHTSSNIYSIYNDIVLSGIPVCDMTIPKLGITSPDIKTFKRDCSIMSGAEAVITFGIGGNFVLASGTAKKLISFCHDQYNFYFDIFRDLPGYIVSPSHELFLNSIKEL